MPRIAHLALLLALTIPAAAQQIEDPANLMGERVSPQALADDLPINHGAPALEQLLRKLRTRASMMMIVAHPDDEDSGLLTYESRGKGARVAMLTLTRGEGGQNLMSSDFNDALGLIRTQELLAEDRYTGTDQFFGTEVDFGFSKTKEETLRKWTHDRVLYDAVRAVRLYRPLVLASVFIGGVTDGHGHHQVAGQIAQEVFLAAADPKVFPEMGLPPWAPLRVYARVPFARITPEGMFDYATGKFMPPHFHNYVTGADSTTTPVATVTIHEGDKPNIPAFNGMSYAQWARQGLALQKTQIGPNFRIPAGVRYDAGYTLYGSREHCTATNPDAPCLESETWVPTKPTSAASEIGQGFSPAITGAGKDGASAPGTSSDPDQDLFSGIDTSFTSIATLAPDAPPALPNILRAIDAQTQKAQELFSATQPELAAPPLRNALSLLDELILHVEATPIPSAEKFNLLHELRVKQAQFNKAITLAIDLSLAASVVSSKSAADPIPGNPVHLDVQSFNSGKATINLVSIHLGIAGGLSITQRPDFTSSTPAKELDVKLGGDIPATTPLTQPYFSRSSIEQPFYEIASPALRGAPMTPDPIALSLQTTYQGVPVELFSSARITSSPGIRAAAIVPAISIGLTPSTGIVPLDTHQLTVRVTLAADRAESSGTLRLEAPQDWRIAPASVKFSLHTLHETKEFTFQVIPNGTVQGRIYRIEAIAESGGKAYTDGYRPIGYTGITTTNYYTPATYCATAVDVTTAPNLHIAYLPGTGDEVPEFLPSLGIAPTILALKDLTPDTLKQYDAVVLGVRAYSAHPDLAGAPSDALTAYAKQGGVVIAQYSSAGFKPESAPFPYTVPGDSAHNVVEEEHPVTILAPENPLLTWPNRITPADFDHWTEERGHGFATEWAPEYTPLLEMHDDGQDPQKGGLLVAKVGKGAYIYCALALYRQLPEGVPGAYRLVSNLLSYAKNPSR
jgi:LmbE family N-acetylglucosaminyl deacetylase